MKNKLVDLHIQIILKDEETKPVTEPEFKLIGSFLAELVKEMIQQSDNEEE